MECLYPWDGSFEFFGGNVGNTDGGLCLMYRESGIRGSDGARNQMTVALHLFLGVVRSRIERLEQFATSPNRPRLGGGSFFGMGRLLFRTGSTYFDLLPWVLPQAIFQ